MNKDTLKRLVILLGFAAAVTCMLINMAIGADLFYAAFTSLCVMLGVSVVTFYMLKAIAFILLKHLKEQSRRQLEEADDDMIAPDDVGG